MSNNYRADTRDRLISTLIATVPKDPEIFGGGGSSLELKYEIYKIFQEAGYTGDASDIFENIVNILNGEESHGGVQFYDSFEEFPEYGNEKLIYVDNSTKTMYQWTNIDGIDTYIELIPNDVIDHIENYNIHFEKDSDGELAETIRALESEIGTKVAKDDYENDKDNINNEIKEIKDELETKASNENVTNLYFNISNLIDEVEYGLENKIEAVQGEIDSINQDINTKASNEDLEDLELRVQAFSEEVKDKVDELEDDVNDTRKRSEEIYGMILEHINNSNIHVTEAEKRAIANILGLKYDPNGELLKFKYLEV